MTDLKMRRHYLASVILGQLLFLITFYQKYKPYLVGLFSAVPKTLIAASYW